MPSFDLFLASYIPFYEKLTKMNIKYVKFKVKTCLACQIPYSEKLNVLLGSSA